MSDEIESVWAERTVYITADCPECGGNDEYFEEECEDCGREFYVTRIIDISYDTKPKEATEE